MRRFALIAAVVSVASFSSLSRSQTSTQDVGTPNTGIELQHECHFVLAPQGTPESMMKGAHCLGYISGVAFTLSMWEATNKDKHLGLRDVPACLPDGSVEEYVKVVLHYLDEHPNKLHLSYGVLTLLALQDAYPCH